MLRTVFSRRVNSVRFEPMCFTFRFRSASSRHTRSSGQFSKRNELTLESESNGISGFRRSRRRNRPPRQSRMISHHGNPTRAKSTPFGTWGVGSAPRVPSPSLPPSPPGKSVPRAYFSRSGRESDGVRSGRRGRREGCPDDGSGWMRT